MYFFILNSNPINVFQGFMIDGAETKICTKASIVPEHRHNSFRYLVDCVVATKVFGFHISIFGYVVAEVLSRTSITRS